MNTTWLTLSKERRMELLNQATELTGLPEIAIEKDWWVTLALKASFELKYSSSIVFKGGTCLLYTSPSPRDRTRSRMPSSA